MLATGLMVGLLLWTVACLTMAGRYPATVRAAAGDAWRAGLELAYEASEGDAARIAAVNDALADVEHDLDVASRWPQTARRLSIYGWLLVVLVGLMWSREPALLASLPIGFVAVVGTELARRRGAGNARASRERADRVVAEVAGDLVHRDVVMPTRRVRRRRRGRR